MLYEPYESEDAPSCPVCLEPFRWGAHIDLICGHELCASCMRRSVIERIKSEGTPRIAFPCPCCRRCAHACVLVVGEGLDVPKNTALHAVEDIFGNFHTTIMEHADGGLSAILPKEPAYARTQCVRLNPYRGWIVRGSIDKNPALAVVYRPQPV